MGLTAPFAAGEKCFSPSCLGAFLRGLLGCCGELDSVGPLGTSQESVSETGVLERTRGCLASREGSGPHSWRLLLCLLQASPWSSARRACTPFPVLSRLLSAAWKGGTETLQTTEVRAGRSPAPFFNSKVGVAGEMASHLQLERVRTLQLLPPLVPVVPPDWPLCGALTAFSKSLAAELQGAGHVLGLCPSVAPSLPQPKQRLCRAGVCVCVCVRFWCLYRLCTLLGWPVVLGPRPPELPLLHAVDALPTVRRLLGVGQLVTWRPVPGWGGGGGRDRSRQRKGW